MNVFFILNLVIVPLNAVKNKVNTVCYCHVTYEFQSESSLAKWLSVRLRTKWLWVRIPLNFY